MSELFSYVGRTLGLRERPIVAVTGKPNDH